MSKTTTTVYKCDGCGKDKSASELRRFTLTEKRLGGEVVAQASTELCATCEGKLHKTMIPLWPEKEREFMAGIVRG